MWTKFDYNVIGNSPYVNLVESSVYDGKFYAWHQLTKGSSRKVTPKELVNFASYLILTNKLAYKRDIKVLSAVIDSYFGGTSNASV